MFCLIGLIKNKQYCSKQPIQQMANALQQGITQGDFCPQWEQSDIGRGCLARLWNLHPWKHLKCSWIRPWATESNFLRWFQLWSCPGSEQEGLDLVGSRSSFQPKLFCSVTLCCSLLLPLQTSRNSYNPFEAFPVLKWMYSNNISSSLFWSEQKKNCNIRFLDLDRNVFYVVFMSSKHLLNGNICLHNNDNNNVSSESLFTCCSVKLSFLSEHRPRADLAQLFPRQTSSPSLWAVNRLYCLQTATAECISVVQKSTTCNRHNKWALTEGHNIPLHFRASFILFLLEKGLIPPNKTEKCLWCFTMWILNTGELSLVQCHKFEMPRQLFQ